MEHTDRPGRYLVRVKGHVADERASRFNGMTMTHTAQGETLLTGTVTDQAALHGLLRTVRDSGLVLLAVERLDETERFKEREDDDASRGI